MPTEQAPIALYPISHVAVDMLVGLHPRVAFWIWGDVLIGVQVCTQKVVLCRYPGVQLRRVHPACSHWRAA